MESLRTITNPIQVYVIDALQKDSEFAPAQGSEIIQYTLSGSTITAHTSYYKQLLSGDNVLIRGAEHGTSLSRWLGRRYHPKDSLQNVSIVFSEGVPSSNTNIDVDTFFIVEQYYYMVRSISTKDVDKILSQIKKIQSTEEALKVFIDPFKNNPSKKAGVQILVPHNGDKEIPIPSSGVNQRQLDIANGVIKLNETTLRSIIRESICKILHESCTTWKIDKYTVMDGNYLAKSTAPSLPQFGFFYEIRMYDSPEDTYCLMMRDDNKSPFMTKVVDAPELGENETKFEPVLPKDIPTPIYRDVQLLLRKARTQHNYLF